MKFLLLPLLLIGISALVVHENPRLAHRLGSLVERSIPSLTQQRQVRFPRKTEVSGEDLLSELPETSLADWLFDRPKITGLFERNKLVRNVGITRCEWYTVTCFSVLFEERIPRYIGYENEERAWLIGDDGIAIVPFSPQVAQPKIRRWFGGKEVNLPIIRGLWESGGSAERLAARAKTVTQLVETFELGLKLPVALIDIRTEEPEVNLHGFGFQIIAGPLTAPLPQVEDQGRRLKALLTQFSNRHQSIAQIDLAHDSLGVVKFNTR